MSTIVNFGQNLRFKTGRIILLVSAALMTLNHFVLIFALDEPTLFTGFTAFTLYAFLVIYIPFHRAEKWAWYATWILPIGLAAPVIIDSGDSNIVIFYSTIAALCVMGLLLTMQDFLARD